MQASELLTRLTSIGCRVIPEEDILRVQDPHRALTDDLRAAIRACKPELLMFLTESTTQTPPPLGKVGRHGDPCPTCGETWQWPTSRGTWICSWCACAGPAMPQVQRGTAPEAGRTYCPGCGTTDLEQRGDQTTCTRCQARWLPSIDLAADAPTATIRITNPETGQVLTLGIYRCPTCKETPLGATYGPSSPLALSDLRRIVMKGEIPHASASKGG